MAKKKIDKEAEHTPPSPGRIISIFKNETVHFMIGLMLITFSVHLLLTFSFFLFTGAADQSITDSGNSANLVTVNNSVRNYAESRRAQLASYLINDCFGISPFFILVFLAVTGLRLMRVRIAHLWKWFIGCALLLIWFSVFFGSASMDHYQDSFIYSEGMHGYSVNRWLVSRVGVPGVWMILLITAVYFFICISARTITWLCKLFALSFLKRQKEEEEKETVEEGTQGFATPQPQEVEFNLKRTYKRTPPPAPVMDVQAEGPKEESPVNAPEPDDELPSADEAEGVTMVFKPTVGGVVPPATQDELPGEDGPGFQVKTATSEEEYQSPEQESYNPMKDLENYRFPTIDLMRRFENNDPTTDMDEQNASKDRIINALRSSGIETSMVEATVGPTVTLYKITPEQGVCISKVRGLEDDIALGLSADNIHIIALISGKEAIGIEVPNKSLGIVSGQSVIGNKELQKSRFDLPIVLGKMITNGVFVFDLCRMSHVLVADTTGQGRSAGLNAIITSLLYKGHLAELRFILVGPKKVEFSIYSVIENHFLAKLPNGGEPIITGATKVMQTLNPVYVEMDTRCGLLKMVRVHNVGEHNKKSINRRLDPEKGHKFMPYIVMIIDEFGDLIMTAGREVELPITRIAQLVHTVSIHMIIAMQRPITNTITGTIKANFPACIAFRVSAMMDSRTILDRPGANRLIDKGDVLFLQGANPVRVQCTFIDMPEVEEIMRFVARQQSYPTPFFLPEYASEDSGSEMGDIDMGRLDPLFGSAVRLVVIHQQGSASLVQRKFTIGYNRAGRVMDRPEKAGVVGPIQRSKARDILYIDDNDLEMRLNNLQ